METPGQGSWVVSRLWHRDPLGRCATHDKKTAQAPPLGVEWGGGWEESSLPQGCWASL